MVAFKETIRKNPTRGEHKSIMKEKILRKCFWFAKNFFLSPLCVAHRGDYFVIECVDKIENTLFCLSRAQMGLNYEKMEVENLVTHSLWRILFKWKYLRVHTKLLVRHYRLNYFVENFRIFNSVTNLICRHYRSFY